MAVTRTVPDNKNKNASRPAPPPLKPSEPNKNQQVAVIAPTRIPMPAEVEKEFGVNGSQWRVLVEATYPSANTAAAVVMVLAYCKSRKLDPFKKPVHIVPIYNTKLRKTVETVWPGIAEMRTTAFRTQSYAGMDRPEWGPKVPKKFTGQMTVFNDNGDRSKKPVEVEMEFPEWCQITLWRFVQGHRVSFPGPRVEFEEIFSRMQHDCPVPNDRWQKAPVQMLEKCAEAAALRRAFPEEIGDDFAAEEAEGMAQRAVDITGEAAASFGPVPAEEPKREDFKPTPDKPNPEKAATSTHTGPQPEAGAQPAVAASQAPSTNPNPGAGTPGPKSEPEVEKPKAPEKPKREARAPVTDTKDLNEEPPPPSEEPPPREDDAPPPAGNPLDDDENAGHVEDPRPAEWAFPDRPLEFMRYTKRSEFLEFAESFMPKTNPLGAEQFLAYYKNDLEAMEKGNAAQKEAASFIRASAAEIINPPDKG